MEVRKAGAGVHRHTAHIHMYIHYIAYFYYSWRIGTILKLAAVVSDTEKGLERCSH